MKLTVAAVLAFALTAAGAVAAQPSQIEKFEAQFVEAFNAKDAAKAASLYADDGVLMPPNAQLVKGRAAIEAFYKALFASNPGTLKLSPLESSATGPIGFSAGSYTLTVTNSNLTTLGVGGGSRVTGGKYLTVFKQVKGELRVAYAMQNGDQPPPK